MSSAAEFPFESFVAFQEVREAFTMEQLVELQKKPPAVAVQIESMLREEVQARGAIVDSWRGTALKVWRHCLVSRHDVDHTQRVAMLKQRQRFIEAETKERDDVVRIERSARNRHYKDFEALLQQVIYRAGCLMAERRGRQNIRAAQAAQRRAVEEERLVAHERIEVALLIELPEKREWAMTVRSFELRLDMMLLHDKQSEMRRRLVEEWAEDVPRFAFAAKRLRQANDAFAEDRRQIEEWMSAGYEELCSEERNAYFALMHEVLLSARVGKMVDLLLEERRLQAPITERRAGLAVWHSLYTPEAQRRADMTTEEADRRHLLRRLCVEHHTLVREHEGQQAELCASEGTARVALTIEAWANHGALEREAVLVACELSHYAQLLVAEKFVAALVLVAAHARETFVTSLQEKSNLLCLNHLALVEEEETTTRVVLQEALSAGVERSRIRFSPFIDLLFEEHRARAPVYCRERIRRIEREDEVLRWNAFYAAIVPYRQWRWEELGSRCVAASRAHLRHHAEQHARFASFRSWWLSSIAQYLTAVRCHYDAEHEDRDRIACVEEPLWREALLVSNIHEASERERIATEALVGAAEVAEAHRRRGVVEQSEAVAWLALLEASMRNSWCDVSFGGAIASLELVRLTWFAEPLRRIALEDDESCARTAHRSAWLVETSYIPLLEHQGLQRRRLHVSQRNEFLDLCRECGVAAEVDMIAAAVVPSRSFRGVRAAGSDGSLLMTRCAVPSRPTSAAASATGAATPARAARLLYSETAWVAASQQKFLEDEAQRLEELRTTPYRTATAASLEKKSYVLVQGATRERESALVDSPGVAPRPPPVSRTSVAPPSRHYSMEAADVEAATARKL